MPDWKSYVRLHLRLRGQTPEREAEIVDDLAQQLEDAYQDGLARGFDDAQASAYARQQIPDWASLSRDLQQTRRGALNVISRAEMSTSDAAARGGWTSAFAGLSHDLLFALRMMRKSAGFTVAAVLTLALGIGANSTIFGVINATLLRRLPFPEPDRLMLVWMTYGKGSDNLNIVSAPVFWDWQRQNHVFERMAIFDSAGKGYNLGADGTEREPEQVSGVRVTSEYFETLGVRPFLGRGFLPEEETLGKDHEVVISYGLWQRRYGGDPSLLGKQIRMDGEPYTVIGIMPRDFTFQFWSDRRELWVPAGWTEGDRSRGSNSFIAIARLKPGVTIAQAQEEMSAIQAHLAQQYKENHNTGAVVMRIGDYGLETVQRITRALLAAVAFVLLIGCVNVANLLLARGGERRKEFAVRRALGASGVRIVRQLLAESLLLSLAGGAAGLALAYWGSSLLRGILPRDFRALPLRPLEAVGLDARVLGFTFALTCLTAIVFGIAPAVTAVRGNLNQPLKEGGRGSTEGGRNVLRHVLVASEIALTLVVLAAAGLMIKSMARLIAVDPGFDPNNVLVMELSLPQENTYYGPPTHPRFCQDLHDRVAAIPGVTSASAAAHLPMRGTASRGFVIEGRPIPAENEEPSGFYTVTCPDYFRTMGAPVIKGREFTPQDTQGSAGVVIINEALARKYWPNQDPLGKRIDIDREGRGTWLTIVGVVGNMRHFGLERDAPRHLFRPYTQAAWPWMQVVVRTAAEPLTFARQVKQAMLAVEPDRPVAGARRMQDVVRGSMGSRRFPMLLLAAFSGLALVLAAVGIVGVVSYAVTQRTHEIGIRIALGAQARDVLRLMVAGSMRWVLLGVVVGIGGAVALMRFLSSLLYAVRPTDPIVLGTVAAALFGVALAASYFPARRATRVDPLVTLRNE